MLDTNLVAPVQLLRAALPHLRRQGSGHSTQISSAVSRTGMAGEDAFAGRIAEHRSQRALARSTDR